MHQRKTIARVGREKRACRKVRAVRAEITVFDDLIFVNIREVFVPVAVVFVTA